MLLDFLSSFFHSLMKNDRNFSREYSFIIFSLLFLHSLMNFHFHFLKTLSKRIKLWKNPDICCASCTMVGLTMLNHEEICRMSFETNLNWKCCNKCNKNIVFHLISWKCVTVVMKKVRNDKFLRKFFVLIKHCFIALIWAIFPKSYETLVKELISFFLISVSSFKIFVNSKLFF